MKPIDEGHTVSFERLTRRNLLGMGLAFAAFFAVLIGLPAPFDGPAREMLAIVFFGILLWITEAIPMGLTSIFVLVLMLLFHPVSMEVVYSGFSSSAVFLIIGGMMLARAVNDTRLARRVTYLILGKWGGTAKGLLASILLIPQIQTFFIPAGAVRTTLLLPVALNVLDTIGAKPNSPLRKMILLAVAFGSTVSGTAVMTAAIGNILMVDIVNRILHVKVTYFQWFIYALPLWLLLIPGIWFVLLNSFSLSAEERKFPHVKMEIESKLKDYGPLNRDEKKCCGILILIVLLWVTEPLHGLDPSIPALIGVLLMTLPGIGCSDGSQVFKVNFGTVLLLGTTLSMGYALTESGAAREIGEWIAVPWVLSLLQHPMLAVPFIVIVTQIVHLFVANVATAVVALIPIYIGLAAEAGVDPLFLCITAAITCLHGYILAVETMPNVIVFDTGQVTQKDFFIPGLYATLMMAVAIVIVALTWWNWLGLI
ncbi:MAG TPA: DASS family sodium-coupled anion symporter [Bacillales bacterium]|nr:DASS family sodium-coupled anion symporter [Bacillales bacterium]